MFNEFFSLSLYIRFEQPAPKKVLNKGFFFSFTNIILLYLLLYKNLAKKLRCIERNLCDFVKMWAIVKVNVVLIKLNIQNILQGYQNGIVSNTYVSINLYLWPVVIKMWEDL